MSSTITTSASGAGETVLVVLFVLGGLLLLGGGGLVGWLLGAARARLAAGERLRVVESDARADRATVEELRRQRAFEGERGERLEAALADAERARAIAETQVDELRRSLAEERTLIESAEERLGTTFQALAAEALSANNAGFLTLAAEKLASARRESELELEARRRAIESLVAPVKASLDKVDGKLQEIERERAQSYGRLSESVRALAGAHERLQAETGNLARALRTPSARGRWGEIQLKRVVELAGMVEHCDFGQQVTVVGDEGRLRPDLVVRLPGGRQVVVDAKVPFDAYLAGLEASSEDQRRLRMREHAGVVKGHLQRLGSKSYWAELSGTPEFVVMFLPNDALFGAALEEAPSLVEEGIARRVLVATPTTLIALLQTVHLGWREEKMAENAQKISEHGRILHERIGTLVEHWARLGAALEKATEHFNAAAGSFEGRVLPAVRRLEELGAASKKEVPSLDPVDLRPRLVGGAAAPASGATPQPGSFSPSLSPPPSPSPSPSLSIDGGSR